MCKCLYDILILLFSIMSALGAVAAFIAAIVIFKRQKRIALYDKRIEIWDAHNSFIRNDLFRWERDGDIKMISQYSREQIEALFDKEFASLHDRLLNECDQRNILIGDRNYAKYHGECHGRTEEEIETELQDQYNRIIAKLEATSKTAYTKWLKL